MPSADLIPIESAEEWDKIEVGGLENPGICVLSGFKRDYGWDVKKGKGTKGATLTLTEFPPIEGTATISLWEPTHFQEWAVFKELFNYDPAKKKTSPVDIYHPALADIDLNSVVCKSISAITKSGKGMWQVVISFIEYLPPPKKDNSATANGSKANKASGPGATDDPIADAQQAQIAKLLRQAKGLPPVPESNEHKPGGYGAPSGT